MPVASRALVELVPLGPTNNRRQLQDSPVLGDVWITGRKADWQRTKQGESPQEKEPQGKGPRQLVW